jgi:hypothetical protein
MAIRDSKLHADPEALRGRYGLKYPHECTAAAIDQLIGSLDSAANDWRRRSIGEQVIRSFP